MYIIHYSIQPIAFSAEYTLLNNNCNFNLIDRYSLSVNLTLLQCKGGSTLVTLPRIVTPYRDSVDGTRGRVSKVGYVVVLQACLVCCRYLAVASKG